MDIHVHTQYKENYGTEAEPYWKFKGGETFVITGFEHPLNDRIGAAAEAAVEAVRSQIEYSNPMSESYILDWEFKDTGSLTADEAQELEYDGRITYPSTRLTLPKAA